MWENKMVKVILKCLALLFGEFVYVALIFPLLFNASIFGVAIAYTFLAISTVVVVYELCATIHGAIDYYTKKDD